MAQALLAAIYMMASATLALGLQILGFAEGAAAALIGLVSLIGLTLIHSLFQGANEKRRTRREIAELKRAARGFSHMIEETHTKIEEVHRAIEVKASVQNRKIVSELQVLENLMRNFRGKISEKAKPQALGRGESIDRRARSNVRSELAAFRHSDLLETIRAS